TCVIDQNTGALSEVAAGRVAIGSVVNGVTLDRNGRYIYVFNANPGTISAFAINATTGVPTAVTGSPFAVGADVTFLGTHPNGNFLYAKRGPQTQTSANGIFVFAIDPSSGALSQVTGSPFDTGANPLAISFDPTTRYMYATHLIVSDTPEFNIRAYSVNPSTGALTTIAGSPFASAPNPTALDVDGSGRYLYVANSQSNQLTAYSINRGSGSLTALGGTP